MIETRIDGPVLHVVLNRPEKRNAITADMIFDIGRAVRSADEHPEVRAIVLSGAGPIFSSGIDVVSLATSMQAGEGVDPGRWLRRFAGQLQSALNDIEATELPVIAALHGQVLGLGLELALACDLRVATEDCLLSIPEARMGLVADVGGTTRLTRIVGAGRAKDLLLTCRSIDAREAHAWGLVNRIASPDGLMDAALELVDSIVVNAPLAVGMAKRLVDQGDGVSRETHMAIERWAQSQLISTHDVAEAARAFMEKRPPEFQGR